MLAVKIPTDTMRKAIPPTNNQAPVLLARSSSVIPAIPRTDVSMVKRNDMFAKASVVRRTVLKTTSPSRFGTAIIPPTIQQPLMKSSTSPVRRKRSKETCDPFIQRGYASGEYIPWAKNPWASAKRTGRIRPRPAAESDLPRAMTCPGQDR